MNRRTAPPFFIVGTPRSGTTLLRFMLSRHPGIYIPDETGFVPFLRVPVGVALTREQVRAVLKRIGRLNRSWRDVVYDADAFYDSLQTPGLAEVLNALYRMRMVVKGGERWGDKTPLYVLFMPYLMRLFPDAQFIHMIRDGRDAVVSALERWGGERPHFDPYYLLRHWVRNVSAGRETGRRAGPERYLEVRYEDLVTQPESELRQICVFLGETFEPAMSRRTVAAVEITDGIEQHPVAEGPITTARVGRWTVEMSVFEKKLADRIAGRTLASFGYPLAQLGGFTPSERLRFAFLAAKYALTDTTRTLLYRCGILTLNRTRTGRR